MKDMLLAKDAGIPLKDMLLAKDDFESTKTPEPATEMMEIKSCYRMDGAQPLIFTTG